MLSVIDYIIIFLILLFFWSCKQSSYCKVIDIYTNKPKTFSSTQTWCPELKKNLLPTSVVDKWKIVNGTLSFSANDSKETNNELHYLNELKTARNSETNTRIVYQKSLDNILKSIDTEKILSYNETLNLLLFIDNVLAVVIFTLKNYHNRVRPSFLSDSLDIKQVLGENPCHPSYPSGHAAQAWFIAYCIIDFLKYTGKNNKDSSKYLKRAESIAHGREIAGVHYPSDSAYGKMIAKNLVEQVFNGLNNPIHKKLYNLTQNQVNNIMINGILP